MSNPGKHARHATNNTSETLPIQEHLSPSEKTQQSHFQQVYPNTPTSRYNRANYGTKKKKRTGTRILVAFFALLFAYAAFMGITGMLALKDISAMRSQGGTIAKQLFKGDIVTAEKATQDFASNAKHMRMLTNNPLWSIASFVPVLGTNIAAAQEYAAACDDLSQELLVPLVNNLEQIGFGAFIREDGSFSANSIKAALDALTITSPTISKHSEKVSQLKTPSINRIGKLHKKARKAFVGIEQLSNAAPDFSSSIHHLLGADGSSRTYLVIAQNNAELRSTGGFIGSYGFLYVNDGSIELGDFQSIWELGRFGDRDAITVGEGEPAISDEEVMLFGRRVVMTPGDATIIPDFPQSASILQDQVLSLQNVNVDGVISIDPICLQALLSILGQVVTSDGTTIDGNNAAQLLLHDAYYTRTAEEQDLFFSEVAQLTFNKLFDNIASVDFLQFMRSIWNMQYSRNLQVWFSDTDAETAITNLGYAGAVSKNSAQPVLGIYLNNGAGSKMSWYLSEKTSVKEVEKNPDGSAQYSVKTVLRNNVTKAEASNIPSYIAGFFDNVPGKMRHWVYLFAPAGGTITNLEASTTGKYHIGGYSEYYASTRGIKGFVETSYNGFDVWYTCIDFMPEEEMTIAYTVTTSPEAQTKLSLDESPTLQDIAGW